MCVMLRQGEGSNPQPDIGESGHAQASQVEGNSVDRLPHCDLEFT